MKWILTTVLMIVAVALSGCSSSSSETPTSLPEDQKPVASALVAAWQTSGVDERGLQYRVEVYESGDVVARVFQIKTSPVYIFDKKGTLQLKLENEIPVVEKALWQELARANKNKTAITAADSSTLANALLQTAVTAQITDDKLVFNSVELAKTIVPLESYPTTNGTFELRENERVFTAEKSSELSVDFEQIAKYDYLVGLNAAGESNATYLRQVFVSRYRPEGPMATAFESTQKLSDLRARDYFSQVQNGRIIEFQLYTQKNNELLPTSSVVALYMPIFNMAKTDIRWSLDLLDNNASFGEYPTELKVEMPFALKNFQFPGLTASGTIIEKQTGGILAVDMTDPELVSENSFQTKVFTSQGMDVTIGLNLNYGHRYFEPSVVVLRPPQIPFYYLRLGDLTFDCAKSGSGQTVSWSTPSLFEMSAVATSIHGESKAMTWTPKQTQFAIDLPKLTGDLWLKVDLKYRDPRNGTEKSISTSHYLSSSCQE